MNDNEKKIEPHLSSEKQIIDQQKLEKEYSGSSTKEDFDNQLQEDWQSKNEFHQGSERSNFEEMIVISQIRKNETLLLKPEIISDAIGKGIRNLLIKSEFLASKEKFAEIKDSLIKIFKSDIQIGYITSTGQMKSTSYIYIASNIVELINLHSIHLNFKKKLLKIFLYFHKSEVNLNLEKKTSQIECSPLFEEKKEVLGEVDSLVEIEDLNIKKQQVYYQPNVSLKLAFIRTGKFKNEFLVLSKTNNEDLKNGITIFYVYRSVDDEIYAVKKVKYMFSYFIITFQDIFSVLTHGELSSDQRKIREAKILSKLTHQNVLRLYDWWLEEDALGYSLYMQSEYCTYPGFQQQTNDLLNYAFYYLNPMPKKEKIDTIKKIMIQIVDGLQYIHDRGIVHRDLKPENIFLTITVKGELQVMLADFDQGKDVRESKLSLITDEKISQLELNSIKSQNTICAGTQGYQTQNSLKDRSYDQSDELYSLGVTLLHLILTFPEPKNRNHYATTLEMSDIADVLSLLDNWTNKLIKNKQKDFNFGLYTLQLELAKKLLEKKIRTHDLIRQIVNSW